MASIFTHAVVAWSGGQTSPQIRSLKNLLLWGAICSILPDADVLAFAFDIPYSHVLGHRGITHSLSFAVLIAVLVTIGPLRAERNGGVSTVTGFLYIFLCTASHGVLDAMTNGGLGIAFFAPFDNTRYFFPWRPILVSPIGLQGFLSAWGVRVIVNEVMVVWLPAALVVIFSRLIQRGRGA